MAIFGISGVHFKSTLAAENQPVEKGLPATSDKPVDDKSGPAIDPDRAFGYLVKICDIGPRISGSEGMERQQQLIAEHFTKLKAQVKYQSFDAPHPATRTPVRMNDLPTDSLKINCTPDDPRISSEALLPKIVAQYHIIVLAGRVLARREMGG